MATIDTPRTDVGNATFLTNGHNFENSFLSPLKRKENDDLLSRMRKGRGPVNLKTPRGRAPLAERQNLPSLPARAEFTPLLHSVTKKNLERSGKVKNGPDTPAFLKGSLRGSDSPALPAAEVSAFYGSELGSSVVGDNGSTPVPQVASSSAQSTPLAVLPKRDAAGALNEQGNLMTLREQENIIDKVEKENFGLKLKILFLEEALGKAGPGFHEAALKENTDLKVDRVTLQRELSRCKKLLNQAERDVEALRRHVQEVQERAMHKEADAQIRRDLEHLKTELAMKEKEVEQLQLGVVTAETRTEEIDRLKAEVEEKDRMIDERDDEIDNVRVNAKEDAEALQEELNEAKNRLEELEERDDNAAASETELREAREALREAEEARDKAETDLDELREEMANKSITTKGLGRQIEEKADKLQAELAGVRQERQRLQYDFESKERDCIRLQEEIQKKDLDAEVQERRLNDQNELLRNENDSLKRRCEFLSSQTHENEDELRIKSEEKDLLHSRHDALTTESQQLQKDLRQAQSDIRDLQVELEDEKGHALDNERNLRLEARNNVERLTEEIEKLHRDISNSESHTAAQKDLWESQRRGLETQKRKAEEQAAGLQRTISKLQETEGTLSNRELCLQQALESEKERHNKEEAILDDRVKDLTTELRQAHDTVEDLRHELFQAQEDLRVIEKAQATWEEKIQALEDEIDVLQTELDDQVDDVGKETQHDRQRAGDLQTELTAAKEQLDDAVAEKQNLQDRLARSSLELHQAQKSLIDQQEQSPELSVVRKDLSAALQRETEFAQREVTQKEIVRGLKQQVERLQREAHEAALAQLATKSPSSAEGSSRKNEVTELRQQVADAQRQLRDTRRKSREDLLSSQKLLQAAQHDILKVEETRDQLELDLSSARQDQESLKTQHAAATATVSRLRARINNIEQDLRQNRRRTMEDDTIAEERKDLHGLLKDAKLEAEDLQLQLVSREASIANLTAREKEVRQHLKRIRDERATQGRKSQALAIELDRLQLRHERTVESFSQQQQKWEEERRAMTSRVRFPNTSYSEVHGDNKAGGQQVETRHANELRGLAKQIQWLKAKCQREEDFRVGLVYEKKFLLMRIGMFEACNATDLELLTEMGVNINAKVHKSTRMRVGEAAIRDQAHASRSRKPRSLKAIALAVVAQARMKRMAGRWAKQRDIKESIEKKLDAVRRKRKNPHGHFN